VIPGQVQPLTELTYNGPYEGRGFLPVTVRGSGLGMALSGR